MGFVFSFDRGRERTHPTVHHVTTGEVKDAVSQSGLTTGGGSER